MFVFRVSSAFVVTALLVKSALFVADDSKFLEVEALGAIEKRVGKLIDEAMRDRKEAEDRADEAAELSEAVWFTRTRKAIRFCVDGVCTWTRAAAIRIARGIGLEQHSVVPTSAHDVAPTAASLRGEAHPPLGSSVGRAPA